MNPPGTALISRIAHTVIRHTLINPGDTLIVGLSGGADSIALLDLLSRLPEYNLRLIAVHLNHCLRGAESDADEEFSRGAALRYGIPFESVRKDVKKHAEERHLNLEDAGRLARIDLFEEISRKYGAAAVALAHHADDQAETVLMRLLRGAGMTGLSGMSYRNSRGYIRPLLDISRSDIERYLRECGLSWREDASNGDTIYLRNRIRHQLLPLLEEYNPAIRARLAATATIIRGDEGLLQTLTEQAFTDLCRVGESVVTCSVAYISRFDRALQSRVIRHAFKQLTGTLEKFSQRHVDAVCEIINSGRPNVWITLPHGVEVVKEYDTLKWVRSETYGSTYGCTSDVDIHINEPGCYLMTAGSCISVEMVPAAVFPAEQNIIYVDMAKSPFPWIARTFRPGDRMIPIGMQGRKKVKDIFIDKKIPFSQRSQIPLLWCGPDLIWIAGVCISELCRIDIPSAAFARVTWHSRDEVE
ncbi:MAG: tRNA lysidine(34) synthetase TilS [Desulfuromonadaceae bacterium]|nr:tRNA lysidine(34) synthetase TilS [Desulfuromonadaceae bacterium]